MSIDAASLVELLESKNLKLAIAESLTGGLLTAEFVSVPGASKIFLGSIVAYETALKHELLGVSKLLLDANGPVSAEVAAQMAAGIRSKFANKLNLEESQIIAVSTTGVAGPGPDGTHAAGEVFIGIASPAGEAVYAHEFTGDRQKVRQSTVSASLEHIWEQINQ